MKGYFLFAFKFFYGITKKDFALVAELVDAADLKSVARKGVPVRFRPSAPVKKHPKGCFFSGTEAGLWLVSRDIPCNSLRLLGL